jgi:predicted ester cyclase
MKSIVTMAGGIALTLAVALTPARADDRAVVEAFYTQVVSHASSPDVPVRAQKILAANWVSIGDYSGKTKTREAFVGQVQGFGKLIPDLKFVAQDIIQQGNRFIVRGRATGTPNGPFFGVPASGKSFDIMSIDIHAVENGLIVKSYHVEDWASALRQLSAK